MSNFFGDLKEGKGWEGVGKKREKGQEENSYALDKCYQHRAWEQGGVCYGLNICVSPNSC
jgi:hypothetical protein